MNSTPTVLLMCLADPASNPRPRRAIHLFYQQGFAVDTLSFAISGNLPVRFSYVIPCLPTSLHGRLKRLFLVILQRLLMSLGDIGKNYALLCNNAEYSLLRIRQKPRGSSYDFIAVEDLQLLPLAFDIKGSAKILFDAREFYPRQYQNSLAFMLIRAPFRDFLLRKFAYRCDKLITVSCGLRDEYKKIYNIDMAVIRSIPFLESISVRQTTGQFRMVHHGVANKNRKIQNMIDIVRNLDDRFILDFYLTGCESSINILRRAAKGCGRIRFLQPVKFEQIISTLSSYDIGFYYLEPSGFNVEYCLPNKFFEYIQARLALAIGPSPEMSSLVKKYRCGFVSSDFSIASMVDTLRVLSSEMIDQAKYNSNMAANDLCFENEGAKLCEIASSLIDSSHIRA